MIRAHRLTLLLFFIMAASARSADAETFQWYEDPNYQFTLWIDDGQEVVYGLYVVFNESAGDTQDLVQRERFTEWARTMGFGTIGTRFEAPGDNGQDIEQSATLIRAIENFAKMSGHPELVNAPILTDGLSLGGFNSMRFAALYPERVIGYLGGGAGRVPEEMSDNAALAGVPGLIYRGDADPNLPNVLMQRDEFLDLRAQGTEVAFWVQWGWGHERGTSDRAGWKVLSDMVAMRYPIDRSPVDGPVPLLDIKLEEGWLAEDDTWETPLMEIRPYNDVAAATRSGQFWLPTRDAAFVYRAQGTRDASIAFVEPPGIDPRDNDRGNYLTVDPGDVVPIEISIGALTDVAMVEVFDGGELIATLTGPETYQGSWTAEGIGMHALVPVATLGDGSRAGGLSVPVMVRGFQRPGTRTSSGGGDGGSDDGGSDDGGSDDGGSDDGGDDSGADGADGGGGGDGGCGCRSGESGGGQLGFAVLIAAAGLGLRRRRASRCS